MKKSAHIRPYIDLKTSHTIASSFILSRLDYCNSRLEGITSDTTKKLQRFQNCAARLVVKAPKSSHITPILKDLHWLAVHLRIDFEIAVFCFKSLNRLAPDYFKDLLIPDKPTRCLRSSDKNLLVVPQAPNPPTDIWR